VALDGTGNRAQAAADATDMGQQIRKTGIDSIVIDTGARPDQSLSQLATAMAGHYIALPRANAERLSDSVSSHLMA
jgi:magnesium chelatase subunit D